MKKRTLYLVWLLIFSTITTNISYAVHIENAHKIPFEYINGLIIIDANIDGRIGAFIVDTGSSDVLIDGIVNNDSESFASSDATVTGSETVINQLTIGDLKRENVIAYTVNLGEVEKYISRDLTGILGSSVFSPNTIDIDFSTNTILLTKSTVHSYMYEDLYVTSIQWYEGVPLLDVIIKGATFTFIMDTGATNHFIDTLTTESLALPFIHSDINKNITTSFSSDTKSEYVIVPRVKIGDKFITECEMLSLDMSHLSKALGIPIHGLISVSKLSDRVLFDLDKNRVLF